jgi:hypothetical protein
MIAGVLVAGWVQSGWADCHYFRVGYKLSRCVAMRDAAPPPVQDSDDFLMEDVPQTASARISCNCDYALKGSAALCDFDRSEDQSSTIPAPNLVETCARAKSLCQEICPREVTF